jgi:hypothetical protein
LVVNPEQGLLSLFPASLLIRGTGKLKQDFGRVSPVRRTRDLDHLYCVSEAEDESGACR